MKYLGSEKYNTAVTISTTIPYGVKLLPEFRYRSNIDFKALILKSQKQEVHLSPALCLYKQ